MAGAGPKTTADAGAGETNMSTADVGEVAASNFPKVLQDRTDVRATAVGDTAGVIVVGDGVESSHADDQAAWVAEAIGLERVVSPKGGGLGGGIASAVKRESNLIGVPWEGDGSGIDLDALLESSRLVGPAGVGAYDVTNTGGVETLLESSALAGGVLGTTQSRSKAKERGDDEAPKRT
jgi:hypothetical protein